MIPLVDRIATVVSQRARFSTGGLVANPHVVAQAVIAEMRKPDDPSALVWPCGICGSMTDHHAVDAAAKEAA